MSGVINIDKNDSDYRESGIYAIKRLFEMGFTEDEIGVILNRALQISVQEILDEKKNMHRPKTPDKKALRKNSEGFIFNSISE